MAATDVGVKFSADTSGLSAGVAKAQGLFEQFASSVRSSASSMSSSMSQMGDKANATSSAIGDFAKKTGNALGGVTLGATVAMAAIVGALEETGRRAIAVVEPIRQAAGAFDQSMESMSVVNGIASRAGLSLTQLGGAFQKLQVGAREGDAQTVAALNAIGLKVSDVANLSQEQLAVKMAGAFSGLKDSSNKTAAGIALFGDAWAKLAPLLDRGPAVMKELEAAVDRAGMKIGPELTAKIQGTNALFQAFGDKVNELGKTMQGGLLITFQQIKPAIDAIVVAFTSVVSNVTSLVQWFNETDGAGRKNIASFGLLADAAKKFSGFIIDATAYVQSWVVKSVQGLADYGLSLDGLAKVAQAFFRDFATLATTSAEAFVTAYRAAVEGVGLMLQDLGRAAQLALSFDFSGAKAALSDVGTHASEMAGKVVGAVKTTFAGTSAAIADMNRNARASADALNPLLAKLEQQRVANRKILEQGGVVGPTVDQKGKAGSSKVAEEGKPDQDAIRAAQADVDGRIRVLQRELQEKSALYEADVQVYGGSEQRKIALVKAATAEEYAAEMALLKERSEIAGQSQRQVKDSLNKMAELKVQHRIRELQLDVEAVRNLQQTWAEGIGAVTSAFNSQLRGLLAGTTSFKQAFHSMTGDLVVSFIQACEQMAAKWAAMQAANLTAKVLGIEMGQAAEEAASATSFATMAGKAIAKIGASAGEVFAGVSAFLSPLIGPAAPGVAAGVATGVEVAATAMIPSFDTGAFRLGRDQLAMLHADEMVVPSKGGVAKDFRDFMANGGFKGAGGGETHVHNHNWNIPGVFDKAGFIRAVSGNVDQVAKIVAKHQTTNPSARTKF